MPTTADVFALAYQNHVAGDFARAEWLYRQILQADPANANAWCFLGAACKAQGKLAEAEQHYQQAIQLKPDYAAAHYNLGLALEAQGSLAAAIFSYQRALQFEPGLIVARNNLGTVLVALGRHEEAIACYQEILRVQPDFAEVHLNLANALADQDKLQQATASYGQALQLKPDYAEAHMGLGAILGKQKKLDEAIASYRQAVRHKPQFVEAMFNLGNALHDQEKLEEARTCYEHVLRWNPDHAGAHHNLGNLLLGQEKLNEAVDHYRQAARLRPNCVESHSCLGIALTRHGRFEEALASHQQAILLQPEEASHHYHLGVALTSLNRLVEAIAAYRQVLRLKPDLAEAHTNLGFLLTELDHWDEATVCFQEALRLDPKSALAHLNYGVSLFRRERLEDALLSYEEAFRLQPDLVAVKSNPSCLQFAPDHDPDFVFSEHCQWGKLHATTHASPLAIPFHTNEPSPERQLRIGYVSPDFRQHALTRYLAPVLAHHDPRQVEIYCYAEVAVPDATTARLKGLAHYWRSTYRVADAQVAHQIRDDRIDILVDLAGHTFGNRLAVFALKPAPLQATWLGYMNTTGLTAVDYRLTDEVLDPPGQPVRDTEEVLRLPSGFSCFEPPAEAPAVSPLPALRGKNSGHLTFGSLSSLMKLNRCVYDLWSNVLKALPTSRLLIFRHTLTADVQERLRQEFTQRGIAPERLDLRQAPSTSDYLGIYHEIDVSLDTFPCSGGMTTCESLWMGVPVVSLAGVRPASRNSAAILTRVGLADWTVQTPEDFVARAVQAANELEQLAELRNQLRERMQATICDGARFTRDLESAYRAIWRRWCEKR